MTGPARWGAPWSGGAWVAAALVVTVLAGCTDAGEVPAGGAATDDATSGEPTGSATTEAAPTDDADALAQLGEFFGPDLRPRQDGSFGLDQWALVDTAADTPSGRALRVSYPEGSVSPASGREHGTPDGGMQVFLPMAGEPVEAAHLRYWVRLPEDFDFVKGGKLPGLYGGTEVSGGEAPDGTDGFSTRLMWRADGAGEVYLYAPGESGTSLGRGSWTWPVGEWTCVEQQVVLDDPGAGNGSVTVWLDGQEVYSEDGLDYRSVGELRIDGVFFSTFFGGADPSWGPPTDQHADFAGFAVSPTERLGC